MKVKLLAQSEHERLRWYIPGTFDAMMVDFGSRVERKDLLTKLLEKDPSKRIGIIKGI